MLELYLPIAYSDFTSFAVTIDKVDQGRMLIIQRLMPDSNRELRLSLNSSAFGQGEYRFHIGQLFSFAGGKDQQDAEARRFTLFPFYFQQGTALQVRPA